MLFCMFWLSQNTVGMGSLFTFVGCKAGMVFHSVSKKCKNPSLTELVSSSVQLISLSKRHHSRIHYLTASSVTGIFRTWTSRTGK